VADLVSTICGISWQTIYTKNMTPGLTDDRRGLFGDSEPSLGLSDTVGPRDVVGCANSTPTACNEHSSLAALNGAYEVQVSGLGCQSSDGVVTAQTRPRNRNLSTEIVAYDQKEAGTWKTRSPFRSALSPYTSALSQSAVRRRRCGREISCPLIGFGARRGMAMAIYSVN
jgi:hypothetical protein